MVSEIIINHNEKKTESFREEIQKKQPRIIEVPLKEQGQLVEIDCATLPEDAMELCEILECESASKELWIQFSV